MDRSIGQIYMDRPFLRFGTFTPVEVKIGNLSLDFSCLRILLFCSALIPFLFAALPFVKYDKYTDDFCLQTLIDDSILLSSLLKQNDLFTAVPIPVGSGCIQESLLDLPCESLNFQDEVLTDAGKNFIRTLLKALWLIEQRNECFESIDESNVYVTKSGKALLHRVKRIVLDPDKLKANYGSVVKIIKAHFSAANGKGLPADLKHLTDLIENEYEKRDLFHIHASFGLYRSWVPTLLECMNI